MLRAALANWIVDTIVPANRLVPKAYLHWLPAVRDCMVYVVTHLSAERLAPKIVEQLELPKRTRAETRLLRLISRVPGLQKLGQVLARNRHLSPALHNALVGLESSIRDISAREVKRIIAQELGDWMRRFDVRLPRTLISEGSVSAVIRFRWRNPETGAVERGVFKVLKPFVPQFFAEDMQMLQGLADFFESRAEQHGFSPGVLADTFTKVRQLLEHEVEFENEQVALGAASSMYRGMKDVCVPRVIPSLCRPNITAMTEVAGSKVTDVAPRLSKGKRSRLAEQILEAMMIVPLFSSGESVAFHADPHAGNILYEKNSRKLIILDWALTGQLSPEQRKGLALLFLSVALRDPLGTAAAIKELAQDGGSRASIIRSRVEVFLDALPPATIPSASETMKLLEQLAVKGVRFPSALVMLSKVMFTLDGVLYDVAGEKSFIGASVRKHLVRRIFSREMKVALPVGNRDFFAMQGSVFLCPARVLVRLQKSVLDRLLPARDQ